MWLGILTVAIAMAIGLAVAAMTIQCPFRKSYPGILMMQAA
jgi:hypothetical protein